MTRAREGVERAVEAGYAVLADGGDALDAAQAAVIVLEDDPVFNAGRGAVLDERGFVAARRVGDARRRPRRGRGRRARAGFATRCWPRAPCSRRAGT